LYFRSRYSYPLHIHITNLTTNPSALHHRRAKDAAAYRAKRRKAKALETLAKNLENITKDEREIEIELEKMVKSEKRETGHKKDVNVGPADAHAEAKENGVVADAQVKENGIVADAQADNGVVADAQVKENGIVADAQAENGVVADAQAGTGVVADAQVKENGIVADTQGKKKEVETNDEGTSEAMEKSVAKPLSEAVE
jgi:hypothetical protein